MGTEQMPRRELLSKSYCVWCVGGWVRHKSEGVYLVPRFGQFTFLLFSSGTWRGTSDLPYRLVSRLLPGREVSGID